VRIAEAGVEPIKKAIFAVKPPTWKLRKAGAAGIEISGAKGIEATAAVGARVPWCPTAPLVAALQKNLGADSAVEMPSKMTS
jgi:hypothetical protein